MVCACVASTKCNRTTWAIRRGSFAKNNNPFSKQQSSVHPNYIYLSIRQIEKRVLQKPLAKTGRNFK